MIHTGVTQHDFAHRRLEDGRYMNTWRTHQLVPSSFVEALLGHLCLRFEAQSRIKKIEKVAPAFSASALASKAIVGKANSI